jgi:hypothetical protein
MKRKEYDEQFPLILRSHTMQSIMDRLDSQCLFMEEKIDFLAKELKASQDEVWKMNHQKFLDSNKMMADILVATLATPKAETVGPVGAVVLATIMSMKPNKEIKEYIQSIANTLDRKED